MLAAPAEIPANGTTALGIPKVRDDAKLLFTGAPI